MESTESVVTEFFTESDEILQRFSLNLQSVEHQQDVNPETMSALYRDVHTLKGSAQLFGFRLIAQVAHAMEAALEPVRRLKLKIPQDLMDGLFESIDLIDRIMKDSTLIKKEVSGKFEQEVVEVVPRLLSAASNLFGGELKTFREKIMLLKEDRIQSNVIPTLSDGKTLTSDSIPIMETQSSSLNMGQEPQVAPSEIGGNSESSSTVRIHVSLLDKLMNLVGEMVLVRNQMLQYTLKHDALDFLNLSQRLDVVTSDLQGEVMKTRMQPIGSILSKFQRLTRDLAKELGKQIDLSLNGMETELDKTLLEAIKDPLTHIIRNACDHGLETPEERIKSGKSASGHILVRSFHDGGHVIIEVKDDGRGINLKKVLEKAIAKKLMTPEKAAKLSDKEIAFIIFTPGFSTAENVTAVSGRGVGMDVVKTNLEKIAGQVELENNPGHGMTVRLKIPLTLAIVPALVVRAGGEQFAIPQVKLAELVRVEKEGNGPKIEHLQGRPVFRLRGDLLALVDLRETLSLKSPDPGRELADSVNIVVVSAEEEMFGLIVDDIKDTADIVVKPLFGFLKKLQVYSGATIMGDGSVSLILDVNGIAQKAHLFVKGAKKELNAATGLELAGKKTMEDFQEFLFFKLNSKELYCLPLCLVLRLEEFKAKDVQYSGKQTMVKYRDSILPIVSLNEYFGFNEVKNEEEKNEEEKDSNQTISLIVVQRNGRPLGIQVSAVLDIQGISASIEDSIKETRGVLGSLVVDKKVITVVDIFSILDAVAGISVKKESSSSPEVAVMPLKSAKNTQAHILFAEDTVFFVKQVKKILEQQGYLVTHAPNGEKAWELLQSSKPGDYQLLLTDIEMPKMTGFELAAKVREDVRLAKTPMVAITTKFREADIKKGREVGFDRYLEKLRSDELIEAVREIVGGNVNVH